MNKYPNYGTWCEAEAVGLPGKLDRCWTGRFEDASEIGKIFFHGLNRCGAQT